jgi:hypothetical protein
MAERADGREPVAAEPHTTLRIVCAWCGVVMGFKDGQGTTGDTHSCCPACLERQLAEVDRLAEAKA